MAETTLIQYELRDGVAIISLDDGKANVFSPAMSAALAGALDRAEQEAKAVVFAGRPGRFSGGFDLSIMKEGGPKAAAEMVKAGGDLLLRIYGFPRPTLVAVTGHALAMGAMFILACDRRVGAAGNFKIGLNESKIGMSLPVFATELCRERIDPRHLTDAAILPRSMTLSQRVASAISIAAYPRKKSLPPQLPRRIDLLPRSHSAA